jgi:phage terminase Nu1 subunit (DNA packaging protein)
MQDMTATAVEWAREIGIDRHTLMARITEMKLRPAGKVGKGKAAGTSTYRVRDLFKAAMGGDIEAERLRKTREEADKLALANARSRGDLVEIQSVKKLGEKVMVAVRNRILNMPLTDEEKDRCLTELMDLDRLDWSRPE